MRSAGILIACLLLAGCGPTAAAAPAFSIPPTPTPPVGWTTLGAFGGTGSTGIVTQAPAGRLALHVACAGTGTLVVSVDRAPEVPIVAGDPALLFPCSIEAVATRVDLPAELAGGPVEVGAFVLEGFGALRESAYQVALEGRAP